MSDIFEEVEEKLREDQLQTWWRKYGAFAIGAVAAVLLGAAAFIGFQEWRVSSHRAAGEKFIALQKQADSDPGGAATALTGFERSAGGAYKALAEMERGGALEKKGDLKGAAAAFDAAAKLANDPILKQSAQLRAAYLAAETESFVNLEARLQPLIEARGPYSYLARELIAVEAYKAGRLERARTEFAYLEAALDAPAGVKSRAQNFITVLGPEPAAKPAAPAAAAPKTGEKK